MRDHKEVEEVRVTVIGCGFSGLGMTIKLLKANLGPVLTVEKGKEVGGVWNANTYPGAACDVPAFLYYLSFEPDMDWSRKYPLQPEIQSYLKQVAERHRLVESNVLRLRTKVADATWSASTQSWDLIMHSLADDDQGREVVAREYRVRSRFLVCATGKLIIPATPNLPGLESFQGAAFHTAQWDHSVDLRGKRVAVVGSGASAIQVIPAIASQVKQLTVFQRSPTFIFPRGDFRFNGATKALLRVRPIRSLIRKSMFAFRESIWGPIFFQEFSPFTPVAKQMAVGNMNRSIKDPAMRQLLTPSDAFGCKRVLLSDDYFEALARENVELVGSAVARVTEKGVVDAEGRLHEVDVIVWATGFKPSAVYSQVSVFGVGGKSWHDIVGGGDKTAYLGMACADLPNFFFVNGPNTNISHHSAITMGEANMRYIVHMLQQMDRAGATVAEVKRELVDQYKDEMERRMAKTIWVRGGCTSWYLTPGGGTFSDVNWPGYLTEYLWRLRKADLQCYHLCDATGGVIKPPESWDRVARRRLGGLKQRLPKGLGGKTTGDEEEAKEPHQ